MLNWMDGWSDAARAHAQDSVRGVRDLFHNADLMELVIATIPTMLGMNESARLAAQLQQEGRALQTYRRQSGLSAGHPP